MPDRSDTLKPGNCATVASSARCSACASTSSTMVAAKRKMVWFGLPAWAA
ncbi:MAG: hypothetical protein ACLRIU_10605 [Adlercreutzia sp.]